jgi:hypothetical protein
LRFVACCAEGWSVVLGAAVLVASATAAAAAARRLLATGEQGLVTVGFARRYQWWI